MKSDLFATLRVLVKNRKLCNPLFIPFRERFYNACPEGPEYTDKVRQKISPKEFLSGKIKSFPRELKKWGNEWKDVLRMDHYGERLHGDYEVLWRFNSKDALADWMVSSDKDIDEGKSEGEFILSPQNTGIFRVSISTAVNKASQAKRTGYCNITSPPKLVLMTF